MRCLSSYQLLKLSLRLIAIRSDYVSVAKNYENAIERCAGFNNVSGKLETDVVG